MNPHDVVRNIGTCPMCGYDSLRQITRAHLTPHGVTTAFTLTTCGRCINNLRETL